MAQVNVRVPVEVKQKLEADARRQRRSVSDTVRLILIDYYEQGEAQEEKE